MWNGAIRREIAGITAYQSRTRLNESQDQSDINQHKSEPSLHGSIAFPYIMNHQQSLFPRALTDVMHAMFHSEHHQR
jgi:hypothetical protein